MPSWWNNLEAVSTFNIWMQVAVLFFAALTLFAIVLLWKNGSLMASYLMDRERKASKRIKGVERAAEQIRKELLAAQQNQDIITQQRNLAEMDADALRKEMDSVRKRYANAEGALKERIDALKDIHVTHTTHGVTQNNTTFGNTTSQSVPIQSTQLDRQQNRMLAKLLRTGPKGEMDIISILDDLNSHQAAMEIKKVFDEQGWNTPDIIQSAFSNPPEGVVLVIHSKQTAPSYAKFLQRTLTTVGLPVSAQTNDKYREWSISMIVGQFDNA